eukprot:4969064-Prorocentrum_lima.AAC.1
MAKYPQQGHQQGTGGSVYGLPQQVPHQGQGGPVPGPKVELMDFMEQYNLAIHLNDMIKGSSRWPSLVHHNFNKD